MATNDEVISRLAALEPVMERIAVASEAMVVELKRANSVNPKLTADGAERRNDEPRPMGVHQ